MTTGEGGPRALDHLVLPCRDLDGAAEALVAAGFLVSGRNLHPWGTVNRIVQFPGAFLELIAFATGAFPPAPDDDAYPFAGFLAGEGAIVPPSAMLVLRADDAVADADAFRDDGIGAGRMLRFERRNRAPDGTDHTVAFSLAFAQAPTLPALGFFTCQQHHPENFWNPAMQRHPNGCTGIAAVVLAAPDPAAHAAFLAAFSGGAPRNATEEAATYALDGGTDLVLLRTLDIPHAVLSRVVLRGGRPGGAGIALDGVTLAFAPAP